MSSRGKLRELRQRVQAIKDIQETTQAMKLVSAAKLKRAQDAIIRMRPFARQLDYILAEVSKALSDESGNAHYDNVWISGPDKPEDKILLVLVTSNRGLCGAFNSNLVREARRFIFKELKLEHATNKVEIISIGKKGADAMKKAGFDVNTQFLPILEKLKFVDADKLAGFLMNRFKKGQCKAVYVTYARFKNAAVQNPITEKVLPIEPPRYDRQDQIQTLYILEPEARSLMQMLIPWLFRMKIFAILLEARASEHGARMTAMDKASENAKQMIRDITLIMNKVRQEIITREIAELITGARALAE